MCVCVRARCVSVTYESFKFSFISLISHVNTLLIPILRKLAMDTLHSFIYKMFNSLQNSANLRIFNKSDPLHKLRFPSVR